MKKVKLAWLLVVIWIVAQMVFTFVFTVWNVLRATIFF